MPSKPGSKHHDIALTESAKSQASIATESLFRETPVKVKKSLQRLRRVMKRVTTNDISPSFAQKEEYMAIISRLRRCFNPVRKHETIKTRKIKEDMIHHQNIVGP